MLLVKTISRVRQNFSKGGGFRLGDNIRYCPKECKYVSSVKGNPDFLEKGQFFP